MVKSVGPSVGGYIPPKERAKQFFSSVDSAQLAKSLRKAQDVDPRHRAQVLLAKHAEGDAFFNALLHAQKVSPQHRARNLLRKAAHDGRLETALGHLPSLCQPERDDWTRPTEDEEQGKSCNPFARLTTEDATEASPALDGAWKRRTKVCNHIGNEVDLGTFRNNRGVRNITGENGDAWRR